MRNHTIAKIEMGKHTRILIKNIDWNLTILLTEYSSYQYTGEFLFQKETTRLPKFFQFYEK